jgi:methylmalonyl-CoA/ethylmalonyl-CoA epimerase
MIERLNHVGIAVKDLEKSLAFFQENFGAKVLSKVVFEDERFVSAMIAVGDAQFEILASLEAGSMIDNHIKARGEGVHHVSLQVADFDQVISDLKSKGLKVIGEADTPEFKAAFIHPSSNLGVLMEVVELKG